MRLTSLAIEVPSSSQPSTVVRRPQPLKRVSRTVSIEDKRSSSPPHLNGSEGGGAAVVVGIRTGSTVSSNADVSSSASSPSHHSVTVPTTTTTVPLPPTSFPTADSTPSSPAPPPKRGLSLLPSVSGRATFIIKKHTNSRLPSTLSSSTAAAASSLLGSSNNPNGKLLPSIVTPTSKVRRDGSATSSNRRNSTSQNGRKKRHKVLSTTHDQITIALRNAAVQLQERDLLRGGGSIPSSLLHLGPQNVGANNNTTAISKSNGDDYMMSGERKHPRKCYVALSTSKERQEALRSETTIPPRAYGKSKLIKRRPPGSEMDPGSIAWASSANAFKFSNKRVPEVDEDGDDDLNRQQLQVSLVGSPARRVSATAPGGGQGGGGFLFIGNAPTPNKLAPIIQHLQDHTNGRASRAVASGIYPFFRHQDLVVLSQKEEEEKRKGKHNRKQVKGRLLREIERSLEDGYRDHRFVTVDVAAEKEGLRYVDDDDDDIDEDEEVDDEDASDTPEGGLVSSPRDEGEGGGSVKKDGGDNEGRGGSSSDENDDEMTRLQKEMKREERSHQRIREKKGRKPGEGGSKAMSGVALGAGSGLVVAEAELARRVVDANALKEEEQARRRAGGKQRRTQVQMIISNNFAKMAAASDAVDPFALVRYDDIETIQDRRRASTSAIQAVLQTVNQEVQEYKLKQRGGGTLSTLPGGVEDRRVAPTLRPSGNNLVDTLYSDLHHNRHEGTTTTVSKPPFAPPPPSSSQPPHTTTTTTSSNPNHISRQVMQYLSSKSKVSHRAPVDDDD